MRTSRMAQNFTARPLCPQLAEIAINHCKENAEKNAENIAVIQSWIKQSPHLKAPTNELLLLAFLRRCCFSLEDTKRRFDGYYSLRNVFPEVLRERQLNDSLIDLFKTGIHVIPEKPIPTSGARLVISQYNKINPKISNPREAFKLLFILLEILARDDDNASVAGLVYVVDARNVGMEQMLQYDPILLKKTIMLVLDCLPLRFLEIHLINIRRDAIKFFNFVTTFIPAKVPFKFLLHHKAEDLYEHIPREAMTVEYGGHNGYQAEALAAFEEKFLSYKNYFEEDANYSCNEKLRIGTCNYRWNSDDLSGVSGSFRKLELD